jgi:Cytochrome c oxidase subunit IV
MLLRSLPRAGQRASASCPYLPTTSFCKASLARRSFQTTTRSASAVFDSSQQRHYAAAAPTTTSTSTQQQQSRSAHAISNPTLAGIEKRWEGMPPQDQAALWMQLRDRMKVDWHEMTLQEKKAGTYIWSTRDLPLQSILSAWVIRTHATYASSAAFSCFPCLHVCFLHSMVDCLWPTRPPRRNTPRRMVPRLRLHRGRRRCLGRSILDYPLLRKTAAKDYDKGVAGGYE